MTEKLNTGDSFPALDLRTVTGEDLALPGQVDAGYRVILFYRGHW